MSRDQEKISANGSIILILVLLNAAILRMAYVGAIPGYGPLIVTLPLLLLAIFRKHYPFKTNRIMKQDLILLKEDVALLTSYIKGGAQITTFDKKNADKLKEELNKGKILQKEGFPNDVVRLNSTVTIQDKATGNILELMLVLPEKAAIGDGKVSIMAPIGTALLGYRKGQSVKWQVPAGEKSFRIMDVSNPEEA